MVFTTLFSCVAPEKHQDDLYKMESIDNASKKLGAQYKYIINIDPRSYKVHTYECGDSRIKNKSHQLATNSNLVDILKDKKYDVCHICYAGLRKYKSITEEDCILIEKYMRLYEFLQNDIDTCEFLMSIFEVGDWYVNNVYTYQGGLNIVSKIDIDAKEYASLNARNRWKDYKASYSELKRVKNDSNLNNKKILSTTFTNNVAQKYSLHKCDLFVGMFAKGDTDEHKNRKTTIKNADNEILGYDWKNHYVSDDCSKFVAAVYYNYINKTILKNQPVDKKDGKGIDLWYTGTFSFTKGKGMFNLLIDKIKKFEYYDTNEIIKYDNKSKESLKNAEFIIQPGDLIYRKEKGHFEIVDGKKISVTDIPGHVEFYIGQNKVVGWGKINNVYFVNKEFKKDNKSKYFYSNNISEDKNQPYTTIIRLKRRIYEK